MPTCFLIFVHMNHIIIYQLSGAVRFATKMGQNLTTVYSEEFNPTERNMDKKLETYISNL